MEAQKQRTDRITSNELDDVVIEATDYSKDDLQILPKHMNGGPTVKVNGGTTEKELKQCVSLGVFKI